VHDGKVQQTREAAIDENPTFDTDNFKLSSRKIVDMASKAGLLPGTDWARGYHFRFGYSLAQERHYVLVHGYKEDGSRAVVYFDPVSGTQMDL
jgi:hypothetical protein